MSTPKYSFWGENVFFAISGSEKNHMDPILALLDHHFFQDPVGINGRGEFAYDELGDM